MFLRIYSILSFPFYIYIGVIICSLHCNENPTYVFSEEELRGLSPNFHIHMSVNNLHIPRIGPHIFLQQNTHSQTDRGLAIDR